METREGTITMLRALSGLLIAFALVFGFVASVGAQDVNCPDIATNADAQAILAANPSDPFRLDADNDGNACDAGVGGGSVTFESLFGGGGTGTGTGTGTGSGTGTGTGTTGTTTGNTLPSTGAGVIRSDGPFSLAFGLLVAAGVFGAAGVRARRA